MIGAVCGLGYNPKSTTSLSVENDIEITFDTILDTDFLINVSKLRSYSNDIFYLFIYVLYQINIVRMLLSKCVNPEDEELCGVIEATYPLQTSLLEYAHYFVYFFLNHQLMYYLN